MRRGLARRTPVSDLPHLKGRPRMEPPFFSSDNRHLDQIPMIGTDHQDTLKRRTHSPRAAVAASLSQ